jgi:hypothetical protein
LGVSTWVHATGRLMKRAGMSLAEGGVRVTHKLYSVRKVNGIALKKR